MTNEDMLSNAVDAGDIKLVGKLIASDPHLLDIRFLGKSWLHQAAQSSQIIIMEFLVNAGLAVDQLTSDGTSTPLMIAAGFSQYQSCLWLLDHGADVNYGIGKASPPIFDAIYGKSLEILKLFVDRGANLRAKLRDHKTDVFMYAANYGSPEIVRYLRSIQQ